jgi:hypothetical protein
LQVVHFGARIGHRIANDDSSNLRHFVHGGDAQAAGCGNGKDEWPLRIDWLAGGTDRLRREKTIDRPARQPD